jgi:hypothetical protein
MPKKCDQDPKRFEEELPGRLLSVACVIICFVHLAASEWKADWVLFAFVVLCFIPWLGYVFESIGGDNWGAKYRKTKQGSTAASTPTPAPPQPPATAPAAAARVGEPAPAVIRMVQQPSPAPDQFIYSEMKILATLWKYQKIHFSGSPQQRWTFTVGQGSPEYTTFSLGFLQLVRKGLADIAPNNAQVMLTEAGYAFCQMHDAELSRWQDTYDRFSN